MKRIKRLLIAFLILLLFNGCVRNNTNVKINKDKSMTYETEILLSSLISDEYSSSIARKAKEYEDKGFKVIVSTEKDNNGNSVYSGEKIIKNINNIDDLSSDKLERVDIFDIFDRDVKLFKLEKGFFKDKYTASFEFEINSKDYINKKEELKDKTLDDNTEDDLENEEDLGESEFRYNVTLPYKNISNNAHEISEDGKSLVWILNVDSGKQIIDYSFEIYNITHLIIVYGIMLIIDIILIVLIIIFYKKRKAYELNPKKWTVKKREGYNI